MRELERKIVQLESMYAAAEKASTRVYIMPNVERLSLEKWHEMVEHPEGWMWRYLRKGWHSLGIIYTAR